MIVDEIAQTETTLNLNVFEELDKREWTDAKKNEYFHSIGQQMNGSLESFIGSFRAMGKQGEVQEACPVDGKLTDEAGFAIDLDTRPRLI